jgi:hypothetical protein
MLIIGFSASGHAQSPNVPYTEYAFVDSQQLLSLPSEDVAFLASKGQ